MVDDTLYPDSPRTLTAADQQDGRHWLFRRIFPKLRWTNATSSHTNQGGCPSGGDGVRPSQHDSFDWSGNSTNPNKVHFFTRLIDEVPGFAARYGVGRAASPKPNGEPSKTSLSAGSSASGSHHRTKHAYHSSLSATPPSTRASFTSSATTVQDGTSSGKDPSSDPPRSAFELERANSFDEDACELKLEDIIALYDEQTEDEIDAFVSVVTSPGRASIVDAQADDSFAALPKRSGPSHGNAPRSPVWNGTVLELGVSLGDELVVGGVRWRQAGRKVSHENLNGR